MEKGEGIGGIRGRKAGESPEAGDSVRVERAPQSSVSLKPEREAGGQEVLPGRKVEEIRKVRKYRKCYFSPERETEATNTIRFFFKKNLDGLFFKKLSAEGIIRRKRYKLCTERHDFTCLYYFLASGHRLLFRF